MDQETLKQQILVLLNEKFKIEKELDIIRKQLKLEASELLPETFEKYGYDDAKKVFDNIKYYFSTTLPFQEILERKKAEKYPELLKPTYYPEINQLPVSDAEKLRLDKAARNNFKNHINKHNIQNSKYPLSFSDLELLKSIGITEKKYVFKCPACGCSCGMQTESDLEKFKKAWSLESLNEQRELTDSEYSELDTLQEEGYIDIPVYCLECGEEDSLISNEQELENYAKDHVETVYIVKKQPNLEYEKL